MTQDQAAAPSPAVSLGTSLFNEHPEDVIASVALGAAKLFELRALLAVIATSAPAYSDIQMLANLGIACADDTGNYLDVQRERYATAFQAAKEG